MLNRKLSSVETNSLNKKLDPKTKYERNYELVTEDTILHRGRTLTRIRATADYPNFISGHYDYQSCVKKGSLGGYIESLANLSGRAWLGEGVKVFDNAKVYGDAWLTSDTEIYDNAKIYGSAKISLSKVGGNSRIFGKATIRGGVLVYGSAQISGDSTIQGSEIYGRAKIFGLSIIDESTIHGNSILDNATVTTGGEVYGNANLRHAYVCTYAKVYGDSEIFGNLQICGGAEVFGDAKWYCPGFPSRATDNFRTEDTNLGKRNFISGTGEDDSSYYSEE